MVARLNAASLDVAGRIAFYRGDLLEPLGGLGLERQVDFILSNPPYIGEAELASLEPEVRDHDPRPALTPGPDALAIHRRLAAEAPPFLRPGGCLVVEMGAGQEAPLRRIYGGAGSVLEIVETIPDLAGIPRVLIGRSEHGGILPP